AVYLANRGDYSAISTTPWVGTAGANDKLRFDLARWRMFERWVVKLRDAGMSAQLWYFADDSGFGDLSDADRQRLIHYAMARLSGYVNTWFGLILEWQEGWTQTEVAATANYLHSQNPWARLVSVMGTPGDFAFPTAAWADYMQIQVGNSATPAQVRAMTVKNRGLAAKPLISEEFSLGYETLVHRQKAWTAFVSGAAGSGTGAFLKPLSQFAARVPFYRMSPLDSLVTAGAAYAMAQTGQAYVFYLPSGGTVTVDLGAATGTLIVEWYDPRTGATRTAPATTGGGTRTFTAPTSEDWVLYVRK
ncbi:MAG TPA: putative collagen-binding domain-containing protein, partial [Thermoanaerobaculia bacterium]|nr:putative collagen-binding domain-containing protein [Thermoanaerobaculia bacterium]